MQEETVICSITYSSKPKIRFRNQIYYVCIFKTIKLKKYVNIEWFFPATYSYSKNGTKHFECL
jgi:hypothetical protein